MANRAIGSDPAPRAASSSPPSCSLVPRCLQGRGDDLAPSSSFPFPPSTLPPLPPPRRRRRRRRAMPPSDCSPGGGSVLRALSSSPFSPPPAAPLPRPHRQRGRTRRSKSGDPEASNATDSSGPGDVRPNLSHRVWKRRSGGQPGGGMTSDWCGTLAHRCAGTPRAAEAGVGCRGELGGEEGALLSEDFRLLEPRRWARTSQQHLQQQQQHLQQQQQYQPQQEDVQQRQKREQRQQQKQRKREQGVKRFQEKREQQRLPVFAQRSSEERRQQRVRTKRKLTSANNETSWRPRDSSGRFCERPPSPSDHLEGNY